MPVPVLPDFPATKWEHPRLLYLLQTLILQMRYRDENSEDTPEFVRTNTVKRMMEVSKAMKPSVGILNLSHIPSVFLALKQKRTLQSLSFILDLQ